MADGWVSVVAQGCDVLVEIVMRDVHVRRTPCLPPPPDVHGTDSHPCLCRLSFVVYSRLCFSVSWMAGKRA